MASRGRPSRRAVYERLEEAVQELHILGGLPRPQAAQKIWADIWHQETHNSTAIEGNTLVLREVERLLDDGIAVGARPLGDYMEVKGYGEAAQWVYNQALEPDDLHDGELVSLQEVRHVHYMAMHLVWEVAPHPHATAEEGPGNFRRHEIAEFPGGMKPSSWVDVDHKMRGWVEKVCRLDRTLDIPLPESFARVHNEFERIHPFLDGNGRTGRLLLNLILCRLGYPPAIIRKQERQTYLRALQRADRQDYGPLAELIARAVTTNLHRFILPTVVHSGELILLAALAGKDISEDALRVAAIRGRLRAAKGDDGLWRSKKGWVIEYLASRHKRRE